MAAGFLAAPSLHHFAGARPFSGATRSKTQHHHNCCNNPGRPRARPTHQLKLQRHGGVVRSRQEDDDQITARTLKETAALDELVDLLLSARSQQQLGKLVAENILSFNQKFWLRLATRSDAAQTKEDKDRLAGLANTVMTLVDALVQNTERQLMDSAQVLQDVLRAAANEDGEWYLPLAPERVKAMQAAMDRHSSQIDEALLSNAFAYMRKAMEDRMDGMVTLLQKMLQIYAARELGRGGAEGVEGCVNQVLLAEEAQWSPLIKDMTAAGRISEPAFMDVLQRKMELVVLSQASGSYAQRVQAEYLKELEGRAKTVFKQLAE